MGVIVNCVKEHIDCSNIKNFRKNEFDSGIVKTQVLPY